MKTACLTLAIAALLAVAALAADGLGDLMSRERMEMIREIESDVIKTSRRIGKKALNPAVMKAMARTPRHLFVPPGLASRAYENRPLPIGHGQTISQPYIVALMTDLLAVEPSDTVLEVGTGSGYQAAVLSALVSKVYSIEIISPLFESTKRKLKRLGYSNVQTRLGDGYYGWEEAAPFDGIIVTASPSHIPPPLIKQLKPGGIMIIPVGSRFFVQQLTIVEKGLDGAITTRQTLPVRFVPLTGKR